MNLPIQPFFLDVIVVFFIILMMIFGYIKGFTVRLYDFLACIAAVLLSLMISKVVSQLYHFYQIEGMLSFIGDFVNRLIIFMICFIILKVVFSLLGHFMKPLLKSIIKHLKLVKMLDNLLGVLLGFVESLIYIYLILIMIVSPLVSGGKQAIDQTVLASQIIRLVPYYTDQVMEITDQFEQMNNLFESSLDHTSDATTIYTVSLVLNNSYDHHLISDEQLVSYVEDYYLSLEPVTMDLEQYQEVEKLLDKVKDDINIQEILNKITVSE